MTTPSSNTERLLRIMARLRDPKDGCAWDLEQSFATIAPHTLEEAYEVAEAIERNDMAALKDELGDLLFQVVFHARLAEERGAFAYDDVAQAICAKMVARHPHVFGTASIADAAAQTRAWEAGKAEERRAKAAQEERFDSVLDGVATSLPALTRAVKLQNRAARVGFDWPEVAGVFAKLTEESAELSAELQIGATGEKERLADEVGDILFTCVNLARKLGLDPEQTLRHANAKFEHRFRDMEQNVTESGRRLEDCPLADLEDAWQQAKRRIADGETDGKS